MYLIKDKSGKGIGAGVKVNEDAVGCHFLNVFVWLELKGMSIGSRSHVGYTHPVDNFRNQIRWLRFQSKTRDGYCKVTFGLQVAQIDPRECRFDWNLKML